MACPHVISFLSVDEHKPDLGFIANRRSNDIFNDSACLSWRPKVAWAVAHEGIGPSQCSLGAVSVRYCPVIFVDLTPGLS